ncbi:hypothetical protein [Bacillus sp. HSf4]|uniref:hypothetical protein n=1 Tax=Bacillus sp. HSf4 TaxID=3035514 RepID=UPI00240A634C|nr:hypothetical protein [Bacillus sp. HSf4]WFA07051.1 hypothetical protein P3X63_09880 [Bacillus sp. HSf4]
MKCLPVTAVLSGLLLTTPFTLTITGFADDKSSVLEVNIDGSSDRFGQYKTAGPHYVSASLTSPSGKNFALEAHDVTPETETTVVIQVKDRGPGKTDSIGAAVVLPGESVC